MMRQPHTSTLFPYTTLFRSFQVHAAHINEDHVAGEDAREYAMRLAREKAQAVADRKSTRLNSSHSSISYAVFCLKKKKRLMPGRRWSDGLHQAVEAKEVVKL